MVAPPPISHHRDRAMYDEVGCNQIFFGQGGAHAMVYEFECRGIGVVFRHPGEDAVRTPGSRC